MKKSDMCKKHILKLEVDELMNYFKAVDKKAKITLAVLKKCTISFLNSNIY